MGHLLIEIAYDENKNIVFANNAIKGKKYFCPECREELVFKNSGKTEPGSRCPHFAHKGGSAHNCEPESILHAAFKNETAKFLRSCLAENKSFDIKWTCSNCGSSYSGNLLLITKSVEVEYDLKVCRPDIALLDDSGKVRIAIEIVKTHEPEGNVLQYYKDNGITLIQYNVIEEDLNRVEEKLKNPDHVSSCIRYNCFNYNSLLITRYLYERYDICPKCHKPVIIFFNENRTALFNYYSGLSKTDLNKYRLDPHVLRSITISDSNSSFQTYMTKCLCVSGLLFPKQ